MEYLLCYECLHPNEDHVFLSESGFPFTHHGVNMLFQRIRKHANLPEDKRINPQGPSGNKLTGNSTIKLQIDGHVICIRAPKVFAQCNLRKVAINLVRIDAVITQTPRGRTRRSNFTRLALHPRFQSQRAA